MAAFDECKTDEYRYNLLMQKMGSYQSAHAFRSGQNRAIIHIKPRFANVKELSDCMIKNHF